MKSILCFSLCTISSRSSSWSSSSWSSSWSLPSSSPWSWSIFFQFYLHHIPSQVQENYWGIIQRVWRYGKCKYSDMLSQSWWIAASMIAFPIHGMAGKKKHGGQNARPCGTKGFKPHWSKPQLQPDRMEQMKCFVY